MVKYVGPVFRIVEIDSTLPLCNASDIFSRENFLGSDIDVGYTSLTLGQLDNGCLISM